MSLFLILSLCLSLRVSLSVSLSFVSFVSRFKLARRRSFAPLREIVSFEAGLATRRAGAFFIRRDYLLGFCNCAVKLLSASLAFFGVSFGLARLVPLKDLVPMKDAKKAQVAITVITTPLASFFVESFLVPFGNFQSEIIHRLFPSFFRLLRFSTKTRIR